jgi:diamine N-acetyltransferase
MHIRTASLIDIPAIVSIAYATWPNTYSTIISQEQICYMLSEFYNSNIIEQQIKNANHYFAMAANSSDETIGYAHVFMQDDGVYKLSKLYVMPNQQGKSVGKLLLQHMEAYVISKKQTKIILNVNRQNKAIEFYSKHGFEIVESVDIPLHLYWLNDFIMEKKLK